MTNKDFQISNNCFDLHVHSHYSNDCKSQPKDILKMAKKIKLSGVAITDHNTAKFHHEKWKNKELLIIPGVEISTNRGHVIGLGISDTIKKKISVEETIEKIIELGGLTIIPHPFDFTRKGIGRKIKKLDRVVVETLNGSCPLRRFNEKAKMWAKINNLSETGGSDAHRIRDIGMAHTVFDNKLETVDELIEEIRKGRTKIRGTNLSIAEKIVRTFQIHF
ncbi:MAG: PHP domain-containing protein [Candidatus Heimdallarchaeota archaeon]